MNAVPRPAAPAVASDAGGSNRVGSSLGASDVGGRADAAPLSERHTVLAATEQVMERARALQGTLRRVADAYPTAEERAVQLIDTTLRDLDAAAVVAWRMVADETALELAGTTPFAAEFAAACDRIALAAD